MAHVSSSHGCCWNNSILYNAVSSNIIVTSNFVFYLIRHFVENKELRVFYLVQKRFLPSAVTCIVVRLTVKDALC